MYLISIIVEAQHGILCFRQGFITSGISKCKSAWTCTRSTGLEVRIWHSHIDLKVVDECKQNWEKNMHVRTLWLRGKQEFLHFKSRIYASAGGARQMRRLHYSETAMLLIKALLLSNSHAEPCIQPLIFKENLQGGACKSCFLNVNTKGIVQMSLAFWQSSRLIKL